MTKNFSKSSNYLGHLGQEPITIWDEIKFKLMVLREDIKREDDYISPKTLDKCLS